MLSLSTIPVVKIGTDMMYLPQKRSVSTPVNIKVRVKKINFPWQLYSDLGRIQCLGVKN